MKRKTCLSCLFSELHNNNNNNNKLVVSNNGETALHEAAHLGDVRSVELLLAASAPVDSLTKEGLKDVIWFSYAKTFSLSLS